MDRHRHRSAVRLHSLSPSSRRRSGVTFLIAGQPQANRLRHIDETGVVVSRMSRTLAAAITVAIGAAVLSSCTSSAPPARHASGGSPSAWGRSAAARLTKCAPPAPTLRFSAQHHQGNEWVVPVTGSGATVRFSVVQRPGTQVERLWFEVAPAKAVYPGSSVRRFAPVVRHGLPGRRIVSVSWDGRNDSGGLVRAGRYQLFARASTVMTGGQACASTGRSDEASGLGYLPAGR